MLAVMKKGCTTLLLPSTYLSFPCSGPFSPCFWKSNLLQEKWHIAVVVFGWATIK